MRLYRDTSGIDNVVNTAAKFVNTADKVVGLAQNATSLKNRVGKMKTSTKVGLLVGGVLVLCLFPLQLSYDSETGEGEYRSLAVRVKRTQRPTRTTDGKTHALSWEAFPTVRVKPSDIDPCALPPAKQKAAVKVTPMQVRKVQKAQVCVPVKLKAQEEWS